MKQAMGAILLGMVLAGPTGAAERPPQNLSDLGGRRVRVDRDVVDVALAESDRTRVETWESGSDQRQVKVLTGPLWATVFRGDPKRLPLFTITNSKVTEERSKSGFSARVTYAIEGTLSFNGQDYPVRAQGSQSTGRSGSYAFGAAADKCVVLTAREVTRILAGLAVTRPPANGAPEDPPAPESPR